MTTSRAQSTGTGITIVALIIAVVVAGLVGFGIHESSSREAYEAAAGFESYCEERFGEDYVLSHAIGFGSTGGLSCSNGSLESLDDYANSSVVDRKQIPSGTLAAYHRGEISTGEVTASIEPRQSWWAELLKLAGITIGVLGGMIVFGHASVLFERRQEAESND